MSKTDPGGFFEDFSLDQTLTHAVPRTVGPGEQALYVALTGTRFALGASDDFARNMGYPRAPVDELLVFHLIFGKTVPDISLNAVANLGYAACVFRAPVFPGDTLSAESRVIGLKETSSGKTGVVYVRTTGTNQRGETVVDYVRWVMLPKRDPAVPAPTPHVPDLPATVAAGDLVPPPGLDLSGYEAARAGASALWDDYAAGERIDHVDGVTIEEAEHQMAARLYHNTARVHFDANMARGGRFGRRIVYGGHVISLARALSYNGLANAFAIAAINAGVHAAPAFAGDTIYAWSEVLERLELPGRRDLGALRLRTLAAKDRPCADFPDRDAKGERDAAVALDLDYTVFMPRRVA